MCHCVSMTGTHQQTGLGERRWVPTPAQQLAAAAALVGWRPSIPDCHPLLKEMVLCPHCVLCNLRRFIKSLEGTVAKIHTFH